MKRILTLLFSLFVLASFSQTPVISVHVNGRVTLTGTSIPVVDHMVKVTISSLDTLSGTSYHEELYTNSEGYYSFQDSIAGEEGILIIETEVCENQIETHTYNLSHDDYNFFIIDFFVCEFPNCNANFSWNATGYLTYQFHNQSIGDNLNYSWDFGDDTYSNEENPVKTYQSIGMYMVTLSITNPDSSLCKSSISQYVWVGDTLSGCVAQFTYYPGDSLNPTEIQFLDLSYGNFTDWEWRFGDGTGSNEQNPVHVFDTTGAYEVCLTVTGQDCVSSWCEIVYVKPYANCSNFFTYNTTGMDVEFYGTSLEDHEANFYWDFGDGISGIGNPISHTYSNPGVFYVTLSTINQNQCTAVSSKEIVVGDTIWYNQIYGQVFEDSWPLTNGLVMILSDYADTNFFCPYYDLTAVDDTGVFVFPMVPNGNYKIMAIPVDGSLYLPTYYESTIFWQDATTVIAGTTENPVTIDLQSIQFNPQSGSGSISGHIALESRGGFIGQIVVYLTDANYNIIAFAQVNENGDFSFNNLANATYYIKPELAGVYSEYQMIILSDDQNQVSLNMTFDGNNILGEKEAISVNADVSLYPNPADKIVRVAFTQPNKGDVAIAIFDLAGRALMSKSFEAPGGSTSTEMEINMLKSGTYLIRITFDDGSFITNKLTKD